MLDGIGVPGLCGVCCHAEAWYFEEVDVDAFTQTIYQVLMP
jgi:hypothetical protein